MIGHDVDHDLVRASLAGNRDAYGALVGRYQERLYPTLCRIAGSREDAHDLLQDAFIRAYEKLDQFHGESSFYTWIYRIAVNLALSRRRKHELRCVPFPRLERFDVAGDNRRDDPTLRPELVEQDEQIQRALNALQDDFRVVVVMKDIEGMRYDQIAEILEIPIGTVRSRLHRARSELRELLRDLMDPAVSERPRIAGQSAG